MMGLRNIQAIAKRRDARGKKGFTIVEVMVALLIFVLLAGFVASGVPAALKAYQKVTTVSNAQIALSTTASALRDELGLAVAVYETGSGDLYYQTSEDYWVKIANPDSEQNQYGLQKYYYYADPDPSKVVGEEVDSSPIPLIPESMVKSANAVGTEPLKITMSSIGYDNGVFTVSGINAASGEEYSINLIEGEGAVNEYKVKAVLEPEKV